MPNPNARPSPSADDDPTATPSGADARPSRPSRREVLGIGAAAVATPGVATALDRRRRNADGGNNGGRRGVGRTANSAQRGGDRGLDGPSPDEIAPDRFTRMFHDLNPFAENSEELREALMEIGRPGGIMDANDPLEVGPMRLITEPDLSPDNRDNPNATAGTTFLGQFVDHDLTMDASSQLDRRSSLRRSSNLRTARFDLDSVYGGGPAESPELYESDDQLRFRIESGGRFEDLPRDGGGSAIIADPRSDENMMISGIQCAMLSFHNGVLDRVLAQGLEGDLAFAETQRLVRWHYQWIVVNQFLPEIIGQPMIDDILSNGRQWFTTNRPRIPVEFQTSAYRFGHSIIRPSYRSNMASEDSEPFFAFVFDPATFGQPDPDDLTGGSRAARRCIGWQTFFDFDDGEVKPNKRIDTKMSTPLPCSSSQLLPLERPAAKTLGQRRWQHATCCATSPGESRRAKTSPGRQAPTSCRVQTCPCWPRLVPASIGILHCSSVSWPRRSRSTTAWYGTCWWPHRRRDVPGPVADGPNVVSGRRTQLVANTAWARDGRLHDGRSAHHGRRRSHLTRRVADSPANK